MAQIRYLANVVTLQLDVEKCVGCGMCGEVCPHRVFVVESKKAQIADRDACMECGACARNCPAEAISVRAGVGCATAVVKGMMRRSEPTCDSTGNSPCCGN